ncbi:hypothetical protein [Pseudactinotalea sp. Z1748]|uniref:hypothetical protein n=1 Tax=Pseudactinotalea sp. Z1748 TaxID=3413027 RepID=UPI003C7BFF31
MSIMERIGRHSEAAHIESDLHTALALGTRDVLAALADSGHHLPDGGAALTAEVTEAHTLGWANPWP